MGRMVHKTPEELEKAWQNRLAMLRNTLPRTYRNWCAKCQQASVTWMNKLVYMRNAANRRTGALKRSERIVFYGIFTAALVNRTQSLWMGESYPYALAVHGGRKAMSAPTKRGRKAFAWQWNRASKRPGPNDGKAWRAAVKAGKAVVTPNVGPSDPRPFRERMIEEMRGILARMTMQQVMDIFKRR